jgi:acyl dehydratase
MNRLERVRYTVGLFFEDVVVGAIFETAERHVTPMDVQMFATISGDDHPIHTDPEYAASTAFGRIIAHGPFGIALAIGLFGTVAAFKGTAVLMTSIEQWRFRAPIYPGDVIRMTMEIVEKTISKKGHGLVKRRFLLINGNDVVVQEGISEMIVLHRPAEESADRG